MNNNNNNRLYADSEEDELELSESYNINENANGRLSCSSSASDGSSSKSGSSSSSQSSDEDDDEDASDQDMNTDSNSDDAITTQSDELELAQLNACHTFRLPRGLCESASIFHEFFSVETWQMLPQNLQALLQPLLPNYAPMLTPTQAVAEQQRTLLQLFNGGLQRFGESPLLRLQRQLEEGSLRPDVLQLRLSIERSQRRERRFQQAERLSRLAKELFLSREQMLQQAYNTSPPSESENDAVKALPVCRKRKLPTLQRENKFCMERARKRYCRELAALCCELQLQPGDISADEEDEAVSLMPGEWQLKTDAAFSMRGSNAADKKCIYSTFFKRRQDLDDEQVLRGMQMDKLQTLNDKNFKKYLRDYKRRKLQYAELPDFDTVDIRLRDICTRAQFVGSFKPGRKPKALTARLNHSANEPPALVPIGGPATVKLETKSELLTDEPQQLYGRDGLAIEGEEEEQVEVEMPASRPITILTQLPKLEPIAARASPKAFIKATTGAHITGSPTRELLVGVAAATRAHACFFSLLRDLFVSTPQHRLTYAELQAQLIKWRTEQSLTPDWIRQLPADCTQLLQSAVGFLSGDFTKLPQEYVPYIEHKTQLGIYQWIGAGRDSDARLQALCQFWLQRRKEDIVLLQPMQQQQPVVDVTPTPPPRCPTSWTVRVATQSEMLEFQRQERLRFEQPQRPFTYRMHGYESVVGPVKGIYSQSMPLNKARGHAVMVDERPPFVTILTLVRDATARLPNGEGTRAEISELLKCSQYINRLAAENVLQTIVSGALDRMHGGVDPCVRYDARRKIWIYLHRNRSESDFERMHRQNQTLVKQKQQQRKQNKPKKDDSVEVISDQLLTPSPPALVAASAGAPPVLKQQTLQLKCPPVPPLKYNIPPATPVAAPQPQLLAATQKSLLKSTQRSGIVTIASTGASPKLQQQQQQQQQLTHTTPILVSTPTGLQTVHVAATPNKKVTIKKPMLFNCATPEQPQQQPLEQKVSPVRQQMPKNIIRLLPAGAAHSVATAAATNVITTAAVTMANKPAVLQVPHKTATGAVQILGPRMLAQTTVRPLQQKIGAVSIVSQRPATSIATSTGTGTIVKMSPQAFATLQQQQLKQKQAANSTQQTAQQPQQQQRILVGNTAISSNKNIVFQALPKAATKILNASNSSQVKPLATANLSPQQQQRIVLQSFKQPLVSSSAAAQTQTTTRIIRTTPATTVTATPTANNQIITLDCLLQKSTPGKLLTTTAGNNIIQLGNASGTGNIITLASSGQQQKPLPAGATRIVTAGSQVSMVPKIIGKTTVVPGKPLMLQAKTLKLSTNNTVAQNTATTATVAAKSTGQNIVIGGQTVKLQGAFAAHKAGGGTMQTVIMGNQLLRLATSTSNTTASNSSNTTNSIVSAPKTLLIGGSTQALRLGKNILLATSGTSSSSNNNNATTTTTASATTPGNNLVFAVQGNGGQLFFSPGLQGVNLKPLSNMKVIPMSAATTITTASGAKLSNVTDTVTVAGKALNAKLLPTAVIKTASGGHGN
ncbi:CG11970 [Drosophila busckii]|uniref:CG11970 n=1 Tax=Drosophila busckii TaxID=30019 RepID=A0A0M3QY73_DROBS|nr:nuclear factor related to kappa-B-binding protein [Drosophila busckii]ALC47119.1 CG11970 [Drosophila busckii]